MFSKNLLTLYTTESSRLTPLRVRGRRVMPASSYFGQKSGMESMDEQFNPELNYGNYMSRHGKEQMGTIESELSSAVRR